MLVYFTHLATSIESTEHPSDLQLSYLWILRCHSHREAQWPQLPVNQLFSRNWRHCHALLDSFSVGIGEKPIVCFATAGAMTMMG